MTSFWLNFKCIWLIFNENNNYFTFRQTIKKKARKTKTVTQFDRFPAPYSGRRSRLLFHIFACKHNGTVVYTSEEVYLW